MRPPHLSLLGSSLSRHLSLSRHCPQLPVSWECCAGQLCGGRASPGNVLPVDRAVSECHPLLWSLRAWLPPVRPQGCLLWSLRAWLPSVRPQGCLLRRKDVLSTKKLGLWRSDPCTWVALGHTLDLSELEFTANEEVIAPSVTTQM